MYLEFNFLLLHPGQDSLLVLQACVLLLNLAVHLHNLFAQAHTDT